MDEVRGQEIGEKGVLEAKRLDIIAGLYTGIVTMRFQTPISCHSHCLRDLK